MTAAGRPAEAASLAQVAGSELRETPPDGGRLVFFIPHGQRDAASPHSDRLALGGAGGGC